MIILTQKYGQLGNRLAYLRVYLSLALEQNLKVVNLGFDEYEQYFLGNSGSMITPPRYVSLVLRCIIISIIRLSMFCRMNLVTVIPADCNDLIDFRDEKILQLCKHQIVVINEGWPVIDLRALKNHAGQVKEYFRPDIGLGERVLRFLEQARVGCDILIGIHIRQGDYKQWDNGRHFFDTGEYAGMMHSLISMHVGNKIRFVVSSNEEQDWKLFSGCDYRQAPGNLVEDMYILAGCDEIYGPQSSFSAWASFYGDVPLSWIRTPGDFDRAEQVIN